MRKKSIQREAILKVLKNMTEHPTVDWIYEHVKLELPEIGIATVYRNLRILKETGQVQELHDAEGTSHFDGNLDPHYHFHCDSCGKILDLKAPLDFLVESRLALEPGFMVKRYTLELGGLCRECQLV